MLLKKTPLFLAVLTLVLMVGSANAAIIATTNFDDRTVAKTLVDGDTATNLNWTINGVDDPGNMAALNAGGSGQVLFNNTTLTKNNFTPALNTGNGDTYWTTTVNLTVSTGYSVTLTDVVFDYVAISGSAAINVGRKSDFTVTLFDPSANAVDSVDIVDAVSGSTVTPQIPTLTCTFSSPIPLTAPGTYTLQIKGGDFPDTGTNETGNHTGIDNLSINGIVTPEPSSLVLAGLGLMGVIARRRRTR